MSFTRSSSALIFFVVAWFTSWYKFSHFLELVRTGGLPATYSNLSAVSSNTIPDTCLEVQIGRFPDYRYRPEPKNTSLCLKYQPPSAYMQLFLQVMVGLPSHGSCGNFNCSTLVPYNNTIRQYGNDFPPQGFTMVGMARLENMRAAVLEVVRNHVGGAIMELGVWRGGTCMTAAAVLKELNATRDVYLYDAFGAIEGYGDGQDFIAVSLEHVKQNFESFGLLGDHVHFVKGLFQDTVPAWRNRTDPPIAVLRVDGNFYGSYQDAMYNLYDKVPVGGIVIFDDVFSHRNVRKFWADFRKDQGITETLVRIDKHSGWFRKQREVTLDWSKFKANVEGGNPKQS